jgi:hypothetical protein
VRLFDPVVNLVPPLISGWDHSIVPLHDFTKALAHYQLEPHHVHQCLIFVRIREKDLNGPTRNGQRPSHLCSMG